MHPGRLTTEAAVPTWLFGRPRHTKRCAILFPMDIVRLTRQLVDIESITGNEAAVAEAIAGELTRLGYQVRRMPVEGDRFNVLATASGQPNPAVVFSTHMDTVPPFIASSEDATRVYGRGSCDAKGIIAIQIAAAEKLRREGMHVGLLFVVGEERDSTGAKVANEQPIGSRFLINGEPTENHLALASKGTLRVELVATGKMAHSAYPELGESAIDKLIVALTRLRAMPLPATPEVGPCTFNIGLIEGGGRRMSSPITRRHTCCTGWSGRPTICASESWKLSAGWPRWISISRFHSCAFERSTACRPWWPRSRPTFLH